VVQSPHWNLQTYPDGPNSGAAKLLIENIRQEEASRAALKKKAEEEAIAKRQQEERIAAERREADERTRREAEAKRQAAAETAKKKPGKNRESSLQPCRLGQRRRQSQTEPRIRPLNRRNSCAP
jgi:hypothetical protein